MPTSAHGPRSVARLARDRSFGPYFIGNALSATGMWFHNLAAAIYIFRLTGSEALLGVLTFAQFVPILVLSPWVGAVADRFDRQRVIVVAQVIVMGFGATVAGLAAVGHAPVEAVLLLSCGMGTAQAFASPAAAALIVSLVDAHDLSSAIALNAMTFNIARAVGPALAAISVTMLGIPATFAIGALCALGLAAGAALARPRPRTRAARGSTRLRDTLIYLRRQPRLARYLLIIMLIGFASDPINTLAPVFAHAFGRPDTDAGLVIGAFGAGAVTAALVMTGRMPDAGRRLAGMLSVMALSVIGFSLATSLAPALVILFVAGYAYLVSNTAATSSLQREVDESHRGRVMALWAIAFLGLRPFASLLDGAIAATFGVRAAGVVLALPALGAALWLFRRTRDDAPRSPRRARFGRRRIEV